MIEIKNLTKIYKKNSKNVCVAVNDVSLLLPSKGMIFITGKSGSGKSTLLNMIGTLDNITKGDIIVDGHPFSKMKDKDLQEYRSSYLGFIFQDFLLLDELTIRENINLALNISGIEDDSLFDEIIKKVDLEGNEDKFPTELSGGQKQRVAIARSLIKKPKMLLCDEPTGNLDFRTSKQILDILKEESKDKLVLIVSHNLEDAENYADRIIELQDGVIVKDHERNNEYNNDFVISDNYVMLPHHKDLSKKEVNLLNEKVKNSKFKVVQKQGGFFPTKEVNKEEKEFELGSSHLSFKNSLKMSNMFSRKNKHGIIYTILITVLFISLFYVFQTLLTYNGNESVKNIDTLDNISTINLSDMTLKGTLSTSLISRITDDDIKAFYDNGYEGKIYQLYNYTLGVGTSGIDFDKHNRTSAFFKYHNAIGTFGTLQCDIDYLIDLYGIDGNLNILSGDIELGNKKLIITDYMADSIMNLSSYSYTDYEGLMKKNSNVGAVIYTGYKERYQEIIDMGKTYKKEKKSTDEFFNDNFENGLFNEFVTEVFNNLAVGYIFCDNPIEKLSKYHSKIDLNSFFVEKDGEIKEPASTNYGYSLTLTNSLKGNEVIINYIAYNQMFGTMYNVSNLNEFVPHSFKLKKYVDNDPTKECISEIEVFVTKLSSQSYFSNELLTPLYNFEYHVYGLTFSNTSQKDLIYEVIDERDLNIRTVDTAVVPVINTILEIFKGFCYLIAGILCVVSFAHIVLYGINTINKNIYEIGVLKALGTKVFDIGRIFIVQIALIGLGVSILSILGIYLVSILTNNLLIIAFEDFLTIRIFGLEVITLIPSIVSFDLTLVFIISIVSSIIPLIYLKKLKPLNILKGKKK